MNGRLALALGAIGTLTCAPTPTPPNVVLIVVDTLRADRVGALGFPRGATPHLDALARGATAYARAYATATWTLPSVASIVTGLHPATLGITRFRSRIPDGVETLAERLRARGYATAAVVSHLLVAERAGFAQGFDSFDEEEIGGPAYVSSPGVTRRGERLLRELAGDKRPFFLFLHYFDPHWAFVRHPGYGWSADRAGRVDGTERRAEVVALEPPLGPEEKAFFVDRYDEEVRFTDAAIGRLLRTLESLDAGRPTIVVATADHGEELWDHGDVGHGGTKSMHEEVVRVPLVVRVPSREPALVPEPVSLVAVTPTVLDVLGLPPGDGLQSMPLTDPPADPVLCEFVFTGEPALRQSDPGERHAWIGSRWKLVRDATTGSIALYDLQSDPAERSDLAGADPDRAGSLARALESRVAELAGGAHEPEWGEISERQRRELEALGYVGD